MFLEGLVERHTADSGQDVDLIRGPPELQRSPPGEPDVDIKLLRRSAEAERVERGDQPLGVLPCGPDERVEVLAVTRRTVNRHGLAADDHEVHLMAIQAGTERLEIGFGLTPAAFSR